MRPRPENLSRTLSRDGRVILGLVGYLRQGGRRPWAGEVGSVRGMKTKLDWNIEANSHQEADKRH